MTSTLVPELSSWTNNRFIRCVFCMDYDRSHISLFGCKTRRHITCVGNTCFMRFHKGLSPTSVMYTSGCLNLTISDIDSISLAQKMSKEKGNPRGTLLCEQAVATDTCICSNRNHCNSIELKPDFSEYNRTPIFNRIVVNDSEHFRVFLPHEYRKMTNQRKFSIKSNSYSVKFVFTVFLSWIHFLD